MATRVLELLEVVPPARLERVALNAIKSLLVMVALGQSGFHFTDVILHTSHHVLFKT